MQKQLIEVSTEEILSYLQNPDVIVADVRPIEAYNGWALQNEPRSGHIKGAVSFPFEWTKYKFELQEMLYAKDMFRDSKIIFYGYNSKKPKTIAQMLLNNGYKNVSIYNHFTDEWLNDRNLPMDKLKNYSKLVYPEWLYDLSKGTIPLEYENNNYVICHSHYDNIKDYFKGHIPGAIELNTLTLESPETWNRRSPAELKESLESKGIRHDTTVILYGRFSFPDNNDPFPGQSAGHLGAIRCAVIMMYAGVKDVRVLNGGITSWENAGYELTAEETKAIPVNDFGAVIPCCPEYIIDIDKSKELLASEDGELVSVRSRDEFMGKVSGYNYISKKGRIPGAIFGNCGSDAYHMENYRNLDYTIREYHKVQSNWAQAGIIPEKHNAFYCGTGWRASEAFYNAYLMGWPRISVFDGGWFEWSSDPDNKIAAGEF